MELQNITLAAECLSADAGKDPAVLAKPWLNFQGGRKYLEVKYNMK